MLLSPRSLCASSARCRCCAPFLYCPSRPPALNDPLRLLVLLSRRGGGPSSLGPAPTLLQRVRLDGCPDLDRHVVLALAQLPALDSLALCHAPLHDDPETEEEVRRDMLLLQRRRREGSLQSRSRQSSGADASAAGTDLEHRDRGSSIGSSFDAPDDPLLSCESSTVVVGGPLSPLLSGPSRRMHLSSLSLDGLSEGRSFRRTTLSALKRMEHLETLQVSLPCVGENILASMWPRLWASAHLQDKLRHLSLRFVVLSPHPWQRGSASSSAASSAARARVHHDLQGLSSLRALERLELGFIRPLHGILPLLPRLERLQDLLLGDEDLRAFEQGEDEDEDDGDEEAEGQLVHLMRCTHLRRVVLYGFTGLLRREERMRLLALRFARGPRVAPLPPLRAGMPDPNRGRPLRERVLLDGGDSREGALRCAPEFAFDHCDAPH